MSGVTQKGGKKKVKKVTGKRITQLKEGYVKPDCRAETTKNVTESFKKKYKLE